ncbi:MAG: hypothetical protein IPQ07_05120 [Myxococcales bacterium]|nr:hypothetical protein [Myxococcales bacterium]
MSSWRTWSIALVVSLGGCGQMYKSPGGQQSQPAQASQASQGGPPGGQDPWKADDTQGTGAGTPAPAPNANEPDETVPERDEPAAPRTTPATPPVAPTAPPRPAPPQAAGLSAEAQQFVAAHNKVRAQHCAAPLEWSPKLAQVAQQWANSLRDQGCKFGHSGGQYGENLAAGTTGAMPPEAVVAMWYDEVKGYSWKQPGFSMQTGHFTQVVWRGTTKVGCGLAQCGGNDIWVCEYDAPGNWEGQYREQVLPTSCK